PQRRFVMWFRALLASLNLRSPFAPARRAGSGVAPRRAAPRLFLEPLEDRFVPSAYVQTNLAADQPGVALVHDPELVDAWGISLNPNNTFWVSARATNLSTVYTGDVTRPDGTRTPFVKNALTVPIPGGAPSGQVFNASNDFAVSAGGGSARPPVFFASEAGHHPRRTPHRPPPPAAPGPPVAHRVPHGDDARGGLHGAGDRQQRRGQLPLRRRLPQRRHRRLRPHLHAHDAGRRLRRSGHPRRLRPLQHLEPRGQA